MEKILEVNNVTVKYKELAAVNDVKFSISAGEIFGIIGPNGAGKTSLVEAIEGLRKIDSGNISLFGLNPQKDREKVYENIGVQLQSTSYPDHAKVEDACRLFSSFYDSPAAYEALLEEFGLLNRRHNYIRNLSGGERQKLTILLSILGNPKLLFLDELTTGLDPFARHEVWEMIRKYNKKGVSIILVTHFMDEIEELCGRVGVMKAGKMILIDTPQKIREQFDAKNLEAAFLKMNSAAGA